MSSDGYLRVDIICDYYKARLCGSDWALSFDGAKLGNRGTAGVLK
jgi:hypothetical protein